MRIVFSKNSWEDYSSWLKEDKKMLQKINELIKDIQRNPFEGKGKPEPLKYDLKGFWSRRIDREHRLVYRFENKEILIYSCRYHYDN
ncbi:MAG: Txe/YoeB family addiction module toxin [Chlorobi bacterium]|nr:Txe/YoeB family addiction module toxin [Chlorobiota bacterium]